MAEDKQPYKTQYEKVQEITDQLEQGISDLFSSEKYAAWLRTMSKFHNYSLNNTILIAMQRPDATQVASYTSWKNNFGRQVQKGEKAIRILAPAPYKRQQEAEKTDPHTGEILLNPDGTPQKEMREVLMPAFKVVNVFDVSQTEGRELPTIGVDELTGDVENFDIFFAALKKTCPVPMEFEEIENGAKGYYHQIEQRIAIQKGMSQVQTVKTAIHEMSHQRLHAIDPETHKPISGEMQSGNSKEVEAESVAFTVCQHYGIDTGDYSFAYIAAWSQGKEMPELKASLNTIRKTASEMITEIDGHMRELQISKEERAGGLAEQLVNFAEAFDPYGYADAVESRESAAAGLKDNLLNGGAEVKGIADYLQAVVSEGGEYASFAAQLLDKVQPYIDTEQTRATEAAYRIGEQYLEIHEASDGCWDYTVYGKNYCEIDGGRMEETGKLTLQEAVHEVAEYHRIADQPITEMNRDTLESLVLLYDPAKSDGQIRFEGQLVEKGLDPHTVYSQEQWKQIESGFADGVDVSVFTDPAFSPEQMDMLHRALVAEYSGYLSHDQVETLADPNKTAQEMKTEMKQFGDAHIHGSSEKSEQVYRYYSTQRPIGPGTIPTAQKPTEIVNFDERTSVENGRLQAWGYVEYARPLTQKQVESFELRSAQPEKKSVREALEEKKKQIARKGQSQIKSERRIER